MFELTEVKEYWCIVTINELLEREIRIFKMSEDLTSFEVSIDEYDLEYAPIIWDDKDEQCAGVYKLVLDPVYEAPEDDEPAKEKVFDVFTVTSFELLYTI